MAKQYEKTERSSEQTDWLVVELAQKLFVATVTGTSTLTPQHHAEQAFQKAEAFYAYANARKTEKS